MRADTCTSSIIYEEECEVGLAQLVVGGICEMTYMQVDESWMLPTYYRISCIRNLGCAFRLLDQWKCVFSFLLL